MEYTRSCDWRYVSLQDSVLIVVDKDVQLSLCKVLHEIFVGELDGEWYYLIDDYSPDELLIAIYPEGDYMYIY